MQNCPVTIIGPFSLISDTCPAHRHTRLQPVFTRRNPLLCVLQCWCDPASRDLGCPRIYIYIWAGRDARSGRRVTPYTPLHHRLVRTYSRNLKHSFCDLDIPRLRPQMNGNPVRFVFDGAPTSLQTSSHLWSPGPARLGGGLICNAIISQHRRQSNKAATDRR